MGAGAYCGKITNTDGVERNAVIAFARSLLPRIYAQSNADDWRASSSASDNSTNLLTYAGAVAHRNVVFISLESTGIEYLGLGGAARDPMPNVSVLAREAVVFNNAYAVYPESIKGLFSVLCSRYPAVDVPAESLAKNATASIADVLSRCNYTNALFHSGRFMYLGMDSVVAHRGFHFLCDAGGISGHTESSFGVDEPATVASMLKWLDTLPPGQRFFLAYLPIAGHHPYDAPAGGPFDDSTERGRYLNSLWWGDKAVGSFLDALKARNLYTNTLFVVYGDHGEAFGQHPGNYGHTLHIYEENVKVPLLFAAPGLIQEPIHLDRVASLLDVTPTALNLLGLEIPRTAQGTSLLLPENQMALFFTDYSLPLLGLRDGQWKFIHDLESGRSCLFDLSQDSREKINLARQNGAQVAAYRERLIKWASAQRWEVAQGKRSVALAHKN
jgi:arylsulfatase A-like enzyme